MGLNLTDADTLTLTYKLYLDIKRGKAAPKIEETSAENVTGTKGGSKYQCPLCGYIYDPKDGDPDSGIPAGTLFEDIPDDWTCPICGVTKDMFEKIK